MKIDFNLPKTRQASADAVLRDICYHPVDGGPPLECITVGNEYDILRDHLGDLHQNQIQNFWTYGRYAMQDVLKYVLLQTGPSDVTACTWAITTQSVETILQLRDRGYIRNFKLWIDPRVKVRNPQPLQMLQLNFPIAIAPVHAKVTCVSNDDWKVSISGSLNFTSNPQPERGVIATIPHIWEADVAILNRQFTTSSTSNSLPQFESTSTVDTVSECPEFVSTSTAEFSDKRAGWREAYDYTPPKCNLVEKIKYHQRTDFSLISAYQRSEDGYELSQIKADFYNVGRFADVMCKILEKLIGQANRDLYALIIPPKRRHTAKNFAECCAIEIAKRLGIHFYPDAVTSLTKQRINPQFELHAQVKEPIVIIFDDIITTGSTLRATGKLFQDKSVIYTVGIYNG